MIQKDFIRSELKYRYPNLAEHIHLPQQPVGRPLLFERVMRKFGARIIVCTADELNSLSKTEQADPLFLCIGRPSEESFDLQDVCVLPEEEQPSAILNFIQRLFDRLDDWTQNLRQAAETGVTVEELLARASEMLQNPIVLVDERGHIVAQSERTEETLARDLINLQLLSNHERHPNAVQKIGDSASPDALFTDLQSGAANYTLFCPAVDRPLYASDEIVFDSLAGFLRLMLSQRDLLLGNGRKHRENEAASGVFCALFSREITEQSASEALLRLGWNESSEYTVLAVEPEDSDLSARRADAICDVLEDELTGCCTLLLHPVVVAVIKTQLLEDDALMVKLRTIAKAQKLRFGVCESLSGFAYFPQRLTLAKRALNRAEAFEGAARFSDGIDRELAFEFFADIPKELICMRSVLALSRFDQAHETSYLETVRQYVKNRFNAVKTANALFIHRSTFLYRLERIKTQFGLDLEDESLSLLHLTLSLEIAREMIS
ncbi:MAG: helix-turn-helix domain-containing protein [Christensenella sp.]|nr:helix-turn-helix domain-containing protein [Christensenella sp.]